MLPQLEQEAEPKESHVPSNDPRVWRPDISQLEQETEAKENHGPSNESNGWRPARRVTPYPTPNKEAGRRPPLKTIERNEMEDVAGPSTEGKLSDVVDNRPQNTWLDAYSFYGVKK